MIPMFGVWESSANVDRGRSSMLTRPNQFLVLSFRRSVDNQAISTFSYTNLWFKVIEFSNLKHSIYVGFRSSLPTSWAAVIVRWEEQGLVWLNPALVFSYSLSIAIGAAKLTLAD